MVNQFEKSAKITAFHIADLDAVSRHKSNAQHETLDLQKKQNSFFAIYFRDQARQLQSEHLSFFPTFVAFSLQLTPGTQ